MDLRKSNPKPITPSINTNVSKLEERLEKLEKVSHKPCGGSQPAKFDLSNLPQLPDKKTTTVEKRLSALEDKLEELINRLSN
jgi:hypothetical protein